MKAIGDAGLNAVTGNHKVKLMAALIGVGQASDTTRQAACKKAEQLALEFGLHLASDPRVAACDKNPLGIAVSISKTLGPALARLEIVLGQGQREQGVRA